jgi:hypothetical protein
MVCATIAEWPERLKACIGAFWVKLS